MAVSAGAEPGGSDADGSNIVALPIRVSGGRVEQVNRLDLERTSDVDLVAGMALGDVLCGEAFVRRHERRVFGIAAAIVHDRTLAEDIGQEAFLRAWRHAEVFDARRASAVTWISTITRNLAIDALRAARAVVVDSDDPVWLSVVSEWNALEEGAVQADSFKRVREALRSVPLDQRRALLRSAFYGDSAAEIAADEGIALGTAKSRIRLGLARVRASLVEEVK